MSKLVDIDVDYVAYETDNAFLIPSLKNGDDGHSINVWVPKSQCENNDDGTFTMPEWVAIAKDLI